MGKIWVKNILRLYINNYNKYSYKIVTKNNSNLIKIAETHARQGKKFF